MYYRRSAYVLLTVDMFLITTLCEGLQLHKGMCNTTCEIISPGPHPRRGRESGELGTNPWAYTKEFLWANQISALAHHMTSIPQECISPTITQSCCMINWIQAPHGPIGMSPLQHKNFSQSSPDFRTKGSLSLDYKCQSLTIYQHKSCLYRWRINCDDYLC